MNASILTQLTSSHLPHSGPGTRDRQEQKVNLDKMYQKMRRRGVESD